jgi:hypothetical protein
MTQNRGHQRAYISWRAMLVMMIPAGYNSWLVHQSCLTVVPAEAECEFYLSASEIPEGIFYMP